MPDQPTPDQPVPDLPATSSVDLGALTIAVPDPADDHRRIRQPGGIMWQWRGDGAALLSVTVATRTTTIPNQHGMQGILRDYLWDLTPGLVGFASRPLDLDVPGLPGGPTAVVAALATGSVDGVAERHVVATLTAGTALAHLVHVVVRDDDDAQQYAIEIVESVRLHADRIDDLVAEISGDDGRPGSPGSS